MSSILGIGGFVFEQFLKLMTSSPALFWGIIIALLWFGRSIVKFINKGMDAVGSVKRTGISILDFIIDNPVICAILIFLLFIYIKSR